ncbi:MAG: hypothetical protein Q8P67_25635 [archaeon]|nr:hypothetical protein [archaeon]
MIQQFRYINDHTFVYGPEGRWHIIGITHTDPADPSEEVNLAHAVSAAGNVSAAGEWVDAKRPFAMGAVWPPETVLWAPYVLFSKESGLYHMFYCGGGPDRAQFQIRLAVSADLYRWARKGTLFTGGVDGRDPMVLDLGPVGSTSNPTWPFRYLIYYCGTVPDDPSQSNVSHVTYYRTSSDLSSWSPVAGVAFDGGFDGNNFGGPTESPFVVRRGDRFYLFTGAWDGSYTQTRVFLSSDPTSFGSVPAATAVQVGAVTSHAPEVIRDLSGGWWLSSAGWGAGGVSFAPLTWTDGCGDGGDDGSADGCVTNLPIPTRRPPAPPQFVTNLQPPFVASTERTPPQFVATSSGLVAGDPLDNAFYVSSSRVSSELFLSCTVTISLITTNGNPTSNTSSEWAAVGSAAGLVFAVSDPSDPMAGSTVVNLFTNLGGGVKLFDLPYQQLQTTPQQIEQESDYLLAVNASQKGVQAFLNGMQVLNYQPPQPLNITGYIGVYVWQAAAIFQNLQCVLGPTKK